MKDEVITLTVMVIVAAGLSYIFVKRQLELIEACVKAGHPRWYCRDLLN